MKYTLILTIFFRVKYIKSIWTTSNIVDLKEQQTFVLFSDEDYDENEDEMIKYQDLAGFGSFMNDEPKYDPLHHHVISPNQRTVEKEERIEKKHLISPLTEALHEKEPRVLITGFKSELDKLDFKKLKAERKKLVIKRNEDNSIKVSQTSKSQEYLETHDQNYPITKKQSEETMKDFDDFYQTKIEETYPYKYEYSNKGTASSRDRRGIQLDREEEVFSISKTSEFYDYEKLHAEYQQQIADTKDSGSSESTDKEEAEESTKGIFDFEIPKNCTNEELSYNGIKAISCLIKDYKKANNKNEVMKILKNSWKILKVWAFIYLWIAIPCWCHKGWCCCCCCCCDYCYPTDIIDAEKQYYVKNPPGTLLEKFKENKRERVRVLNYEPTLAEYKAYEKFGSVLRNM